MEMQGLRAVFSAPVLVCVAMLAAMYGLLLEVEVSYICTGAVLGPY